MNDRMGEGFLMTPELAEIYFSICIEYNITAREDRITLLRELVRLGAAKYVRYPKEFLEHKNVAKIIRKRNDNGPR